MHKNNKAGTSFKKGLVLALTVLSVAFTSCQKESRPIVIWTDNPEFASYIEYFNSTHDEQKAILVYKEEPANSLPPLSDELTPDIIIGPWLKNSSTKKYFSPLDYLFTEEQISRADYYSQLIDYGIISEKQYLLPVSFNLPMMVFSTENENLIPTNHLLTLEQVKETAMEFNTKNRYDEYASMGYAPSWDHEFRYEATKLFGANYEENGNNFSWNDRAVKKSVEFLRNWTSECNTDSTAEENFNFKYLYMPKYKQISSGRCLFTFMTSKDFFTLNMEQSDSLTFRWLCNDDKIPVEDDIVMMGLYRYSRNTKDAEVFIEWFSSALTQQHLLQRTQGMELNTLNFGIANGFSSLKKVNENVFPAHYRLLLENLPTEGYLKLPNMLPYTWPKLKEYVIHPYMEENIDTGLTEESNPTTLEEKIADWNKQYF